MEKIETLLNNYQKWLKKNFAWRFNGEGIELTLPYLDRNNDYIQVYLMKSNEGIVLTDDGATIQGLEQEGFTFDKPKRKKILETILNGHGVSIDENQIQKETNPENFAIDIHSLIQTILAVNGMFHMAD